MEPLQRTIKNQAKIQGVGLHTGNRVNLTFKPAEPNSGIRFVRVDLNNKPAIKADCGNLFESERSMRRTSLACDGAEVQTIEHLMAALSGLQIDNLEIDIDNNEVPGMDGSGKEFVEVLKKAEIVEQDTVRKFFAIKEPIWVEDERARAVALPASDYSVCYTLNYDHPYLKSQYMELGVTAESFEKELAAARTFCLKEEAEDLQGKGIGMGANYQNTLVVAEKEVIKNTLRFNDEFVRHKILDLIGDMSVLGIPIKGRIMAIRSGHALNLKLVKKIYQQKLKYESAAIAFGSVPRGANEIDASMIMKILPHRYPFLLVDRIISMEEGKRAVGLKNVTINEDFFNGHFPGKPVMPGVLIIEAMAQVGGVMMLSPEENRGKLAYFMAANEVKFRKTVLPGDQLIIEVEAGKIKARTGQVFAKALVDGKVVSEAELMFALA